MSDDFQLSNSSQHQLNSPQYPLNPPQHLLNFSQHQLNSPKHSQQQPLDLKIKKISVFSKMSNSVSKRPKFHLVLIILLVLIIIILLIYYRGMFYIGPFCNKTTTPSIKNNKSDDITEKLIESINT